MGQLFVVPGKVSECFSQDLRKIKAIVDEIDKLNETPVEYLAFKSKGKDQDDYWVASTYQDHQARRLVHLEGPVESGDPQQRKRTRTR